MFEMENYKGLQFFHKDELMDTSMLEQMGYQKSEVVDWQDSKHISTYFCNPESTFAFIVSVWHLGTEDEFYIQMFVSRDILYKVGYPKSLHISSSKKEKKAYVYVREKGEKRQLLTAFIPARIKSVCTSYTTLNIIDSQTTRYYDSDMKKRPIIFPKSNKHSISVVNDVDKKYVLKIIDKKPTLDEVEISLKEKGFTVKSYEADYFILTKAFDTEVEAWKAAYDYEDCYYQELKFNPFADYMSQNFEVAYKALILDELSADDILKMALYDWRRDWSKIVKCNLEELYKRYEIPYIGVFTDANGSMVPDCSNLIEVEDFKLE